MIVLVHPAVAIEFVSFCYFIGTELGRIDTLRDIGAYKELRAHKALHVIDKDSRRINRADPCEASCTVHK